MTLFLLLALRTATRSQEVAPSQQAPPQNAPTEPSPSQFGAITPYLGLTIDEVRFPGLGPEESASLLALTPLKVGETLDRATLRDAIKALFASGRFSDIQAEADRTDTAGVRLSFLTVTNFFVGIVTVDGVSTNPSANQLVSATRLQLGELYTAEKVARAIAGMMRLLEENGFHQSKIQTSERRNDQEHQIDIRFQINPGARAVVGEVKVIGDSAYTANEIKDIAKLHSGDPVISSRVTRTLQRIRTRYQKQDRLLAQVTLAERTYHPERNTIDYTFQIDRGPLVEIASEGYKLNQRTLRRLVPVYEEGAVDNDLLNEGRRNIQNHMEGLGFFEATVTVNQRDSDGKTMRILYVIDPGLRHKLAAIRINGAHYFPEELIRHRMVEQVATRFFSHGRYSEALLTQDLQRIQGLYRSSGFRQAEVTSKLVTKYQGNPSLLAIDIIVNEGKQTRVAWVKVDGSYILPQEQLPELATAEGQGFDESSLENDRDGILGKYFDNGFPNATVDVSYVNAPESSNEQPRVGVTFTIQEGEQFFVDQVYLNGLHYTRPGVARRQLRVHPGEPLSQQRILDSQRRLYDLGLFSEVDTAIQNPEGTESRKNVLVATREAKRYTIDYGGGFEFETGTPSIGVNQPLGATGVSPRVLFGVNRINFGGRQQTLTLRTNVSKLQQRVLLNYDVPKLMNLDNLHFSASIFYDNTVDVSTFTSQRLEGNVRNLQVLYRQENRDLTTISYGFSYRRVKASNIEVSSNLIPLLSSPARVGSPNFLYVRNRRDNDLQSTTGNYTSVEGAVASSYFGSEADFSKVLIKNSTYHSFFKDVNTGRKFVLARSTTVGLENPFGGTVVLDPSQSALAGESLIPLPERFFSGGGNSHRGFGLNQAGPRDPLTGFPVGGSALFLNNLELRFPLVTAPYLQDKIGFSVFHDMGNVFARPQEMLPSIGRWHQPNPDLCTNAATHLQCSYNYVSHAIGLGIGYQTPIGPLTFDFGYNLNPPVFPSYTNVITNSVNGVTSGQFGWQRAGHFNFSFNIGQSF